MPYMSRKMNYISHNGQQFRLLTCGESLISKKTIVFDPTLCVTTLPLFQKMPKSVISISKAFTAWSKLKQLSDILGQIHLVLKGLDTEQDIIFTSV